MKLYLVRHGQTKFNELNLHQHKDVELSPTGIQQAQFVAKRFASIPVDIILSSTHKRAEETASIINTVIKKEIIHTELLRELKRPTEIEGKSTTDIQALTIRQIIRENAHNASWHYSDEENFSDLQARSQDFLSSIAAIQEKNVLVVSHEVIIQMLVATMVFDTLITPKMFYLLEHRMKMTNTGITVCQRAENGTWKLIMWNDHAHLGE